MEQYRIAADGAKVTIDPDGGRVTSMELDGHEVLVTGGEKRTRHGLFPMVPWCGRLPGGRLSFAGYDYHFPLTNSRHANHGLVHQQRWEPVEHVDTVIKLTTRLGFPWVFGGLVRQRIELEPSALHIEVQVEAEHYAMPVMAGWHPWFRRNLGIGGEAELAIEPTERYVLDDELIPTGSMGPVGPHPWNDCVVGLEQPPVIRWPGAFELTVDSGFDHWVVFTEPDHAICVEPQSGPPNRINYQPTVIQPGQRFNGWMRLSWTTSTG